MKHVFFAIIWSLIGANVPAEELLVFTADWCGPCKTFKNDYLQNPEIVGPYLHNTLLFDIDDDPESGLSYGVKTVPTFLVVENEKIIRKQEGYDGPAKLKKWLENKRSRR